MTTAEQQEQWRVVAIQCVAELQRCVQLLDVEVVHGGGLKDVRVTLDRIRTLSKVLQDAAMRDGRWPYWSQPKGVSRG